MPSTEHPAGDTMTVRVIDRSRWGTSSPYPLIQTVTITATCPRCGGRRGEPWPHRFHEDGEWLTCDRWDNPCGHVDMYEAVLSEGPRGGAVTPPEMGTTRGAGHLPQRPHHRAVQAPPARKGGTQSATPAPRPVEVQHMSHPHALPVVVGLLTLAAFVLFLAGVTWPGVGMIVAAVLLIVHTYRARTEVGRHRR